MTFLQGFTQVVFYVFAVAAVISALMVVTTRNPVKGVLFLVLTFIAMAAVWIFLQAEFLALILVVVYVGAVMTLFLFVVMMLNTNIDRSKKMWVRYMPLGLAIVLLLLIMMVFVVGPQHFGLKQFAVPAAAAPGYSNVKALGGTLYAHYVFPFIVAGVLLLVAMVSAITLAFRGAQGQRKIERIADQLRTTKADRLKVVKMKAEKKP